MNLHYCPCGQSINVGIEPATDGRADYCVAFTVPDSGQPPLEVNNCPRCDRDLYDALRAGDLTERLATTPEGA